MTGEFNFTGPRQARVQKCRDGKPQDAVSQKLEPLIIPPAMLIPGAGMGKSLCQEALIHESVAEMSLKLLDV